MGVNDEHPAPKQADIAQAGAIAGAIFAALLAADPLDIRHRVGWLRYLDYVTFALWVAAVVLFVLAIAAPGFPRLRGKRREVQVWLPAYCAVLAGFLTVVALLLSVTPWTADKDKVRVTLAPQTRNAVDRVCGTAGQRLFGTIVTGALGDQFVTITLARKSPKGCDQIRVRADAILTLKEHPPGYP